MIDHDRNVGTVLDVLDELGIADDTIVIYSTDNGPHRGTWPDGGTTPFRSKKNTNWEGAYRVPELIRWPGKIEAGPVIQRHHPAPDWLPTLLAAAGDPASRGLKKGVGRGDGETEYKVHIDGFDLLPYLTGQAEHSPRRGFFYFNDDAELVAMRFENWKIVFAEQRCQGTLRIWAEPFTELPVPKLFNLRTDPFEYADITSNAYYDWFMRRDFFVFYATAMCSAFLGYLQGIPASASRPRASASIRSLRNSRRSWRPTRGWSPGLTQLKSPPQTFQYTPRRGGPPDRLPAVTLVPADLATDNLTERLIPSGFDAGMRTFYVWVSVTNVPARDCRSPTLHHLTASTTAAT